MRPFAHLDLQPYVLPDDVLARTLSPTLVVFMDAVRRNVTAVLSAVGGADRWRPHLKTTKMPDVWEELLRAGVRHFKCATTREVSVLLELLARRGVEDADVLLAHPLVPPALSVLARLARAHPATRVSVLVEDLDVLAAVDDVLGVMIDLNVGMDRTGVPIGETETIARLVAASGARCVGLHAYDGHLHDDDPSVRRARILAGYDEVLALHARLVGAGLRVPEIVTAGTPAFLHALRHTRLAGLPDTVHRVSPGTVVFHDARCEEQNRGFPLAPAAVVLARVVSHPTRGRITLDAGGKALAAEAGDPCAIVLGHPDWRALTPNEEHLPIALPDGETPPARGTPLLLVPRHVCPTVNLADQALLVERDGSLRVVDVAARGHALRVD